jgi:putative oxidoreductase
MDVIELTGRLVFAGLFLFFGLQHFTRLSGFAAYAASRRTPFPRLAVAITGVMLLVGGSLVALGAWADLGALVLVVFLVPVAFVIHPFWRERDPAVRASEQAVFLKDVALGGAALVLLAVGDLSYALTGPLL